MELREALSQISAIRQQMARSEVFRGYRSMTVGFSGIMGLLAAAFQSHWVASPESELERYIGLWVSVAAVSLIVSGAELYWRARDAGAGLARQLTLLAVEQFLPCIIVGALLTLCIYRGALQGAWMLPGLWSLVFSLGVFASYRLLPRQVVWVGLYYVFSGCGCLLWDKATTRFLPGKWESVLAVVNCWPLRFCIGHWSGRMSRERTEKSTEEKAHAGAGRFSYQGLDRVMHEKARLGILASLAAHAGGLLFNDLKELCSLTDGNLSRHLAVLSEAGLVEIWKGSAGRRPQTMYRLTASGRKRFAEYIRVLEAVVADAQPSQAQAEASRKRLSGGWSPA